MKNLFKMPEEGTVSTLFNTVVWAAFILVGAFSAMALRGDIHLEAFAEKVFGTALAVFVLVVLFSLIYKANKVR